MAGIYDLDYLRAMLIEPNVGSQSENQTSFRLPTQPLKPHRWEGDKLPTLSMCAEVDLTPINKPLMVDITMRARRAARPQPRHALLFLILILTMGFSYYLVSRYVVAAVIIKGRSMSPTLNDGDRYMLNRWLYYFRSPQPGDLVVIRDPGHDDFAVKRIIAVPFDSVLLEDGKVYVNGLKLSEPYLGANTKTVLPEMASPRTKLTKDYFYVLGDNRSNSEDSRFYGAVHRDRIVGKISR
jgi:signal peptidase I